MDLVKWEISEHFPQINIYQAIAIREDAAVASLGSQKYGAHRASFRLQLIPL
jgi:hypothetical protein